MAAVALPAVYKWSCRGMAQQMDPAGNASTSRSTNHVTGPDGQRYRNRSTYDAGFRVRLHAHRGDQCTGTSGRRWFNASEPGGDAGLDNFLNWARLVLDAGLVHPDDAHMWASTFIEVEGGGRGRATTVVTVRGA
ncbi:hypothetical protein JKP88DRAFT_289784 [Tribonema minus]|uniref:Uncharacterized protein n=1 Tax=Tribonema minus TaxID=303371 RepID=A0A836CGI4_9STRA|nr:hypothetical protein JKP88DRAFT_289784 [Tribonema minus]